MKFFSLVGLALVLLTGCLKTADQVRREKQVEDISTQLSDSQSIVAELTVLVKNLQGQVDSLNGKIDELQQQQNTLQALNPQDMSASLAQIKQQVDQLQEVSNVQGEELQQQRTFIEKVTEKLSSLKQTTQTTVPSKTPKDHITAARTLIGKKKWTEARKLLEDLIDDPKVGPEDMNKVLHGMGEIEFGEKNWEKSLVFFSKIYTKYPKSSLAPSSLLHIGKALQQLGKKTESTQAFKELKEQYPNSTAAKGVRE